MTILSQYLLAMRTIHGTGAHVKETSFYPALSALFDAVGNRLTPRVHCVTQLSNQGSGMPDMGLFSQDQISKGATSPNPGAMPSRGVVEVKGLAANLLQVSLTPQISKYWSKYRLVLITNYREFALIGDDKNNPILLERYSLAGNEPGFWMLTNHPDNTEKIHGQPLIDFVRRVLLYTVPLSEPKDIAWFLASYAREARARVERANVPQLDSLKSSLSEALGLTFSGPKGEHFFRSTLVQTLFYGVFAAWVLWHKDGGVGKFEWRKAVWSLRVPMIEALYEQIAPPTKLRALDVEEVLDWAGTALNRVTTSVFFKRFQPGEAVQYFYEPFLEAFDPDLRKQFGVWYTPQEVAQYMVARVDHALKEDLGLPDGLADDNVIVLDPCCGTGTYLIEVLRAISAHLTQQGATSLIPQELKRAATTRIFGFEILPAPFVVAHLQLGLLLAELGATLSLGERAGVYLTNSLTGWQPAQHPKLSLFPELADERDAADQVKQKSPILVIIGNPPYDGFAGVAVGEERDLSSAYRTPASPDTPLPQGQGLNELYVRFFRMAERKVAESTGRGIVCYISNSSWIRGLSHTAMRERYLTRSFNEIWIDNLNGDKYDTGKLTPAGDADPSIFSTERNREGIQVGTAITILIKEAISGGAPAEIRYRDVWGKQKRTQLVADAGSISSAWLQNEFEQVTPLQVLGFPFAPTIVSAEYLRWPLLTELMPASFPGVKTSRDEALVDIDKDALITRMQAYLDATISDGQIAIDAPALMKSTTRFDALSTRHTLLAAGKTNVPASIFRYAYRPFDARWVFWEGATKLLDEKRTEYFEQAFTGNLFLFTTGRTRKAAIESPVPVSILCDLNFMDSGARGFPLLLSSNVAGTAMPPVPNLTPAASGYLKSLGSSLGASPEQTLFFHVVAVLHSALYQSENMGALRQDWPRVPLPKSDHLLLESAAIGREVSVLLDNLVPVPGVTSGTVRLDLRKIAVPTRTDGNPIGNPDFAVTAGWGFAGQEGVTMPGKGRVLTRQAAAEEGTPGLTAMNAPFSTLDVYLNADAYWSNIPVPVWEYTLGGYQVIKKWLSYREKSLLGRNLTLDELKEVTSIARRIAALLLLGEALDNNFQKVKADS